MLQDINFVGASIEFSRLGELWYPRTSRLIFLFHESNNILHGRLRVFYYVPICDIRTWRFHDWVLYTPSWLACTHFIGRFGFLLKFINNAIFILFNPFYILYTLEILDPTSSLFVFNDHPSHLNLKKNSALFYDK